MLHLSKTSRARLKKKTTLEVFLFLAGWSDVALAVVKCYKVYQTVMLWSVINKIKFIFFGCSHVWQIVRQTGSNPFLLWRCSLTAPQQTLLFSGVVFFWGFHFVPTAPIACIDTSFPKGKLTDSASPGEDKTHMLVSQPKPWYHQVSVLNTLGWEGVHKSGTPSCQPGLCSTWLGKCVSFICYFFIRLISDHHSFTTCHRGWNSNHKFWHFVVQSWCHSSWV